ncbi:MAG: L-sorbosone dehydrogenase [Gemmatimonadetes bacterium]|nr:L-sorbosone dehydrogenase [Gemmatimonadota bacterium]
MTTRAIGLVVLLVLMARPGHAQGADTAAKAGAAPDPAVLTPALIDQGRKIFHGPGNCSACHGDKLEGGPVAPSLRGPTWRHIDGSYDAIIHRVDEGMPGTAMVAHPGGISETQVLMAATYIYAVSHGLAKP